MKKMKILWVKACLALFAIVISSQSVYAYDFKVDNVYYDIISGTKNVSVTYQSCVTTSGYGGGFTTYTSPYTGEVIIPATVEYGGVKYTVTRIGGHAFDDSDVETIMLPNTITEVFDGAFSSCSKLKEILLPNSVTYIGKSAFSYCTSLKSLIIPPSVIRIDDYMLCHCSSLEKLYLNVEIVRLWGFADLYSIKEVYNYASNNPSATEGPAWRGAEPVMHVLPGYSNKSTVPGSSPAIQAQSIVEDLQIVSSVTMDKSLDVIIGNTVTIEAAVLPLNASNKQLFWSSSNPDVASVTHNGVLSAKSIGTTVITAESTDGSGKIASCVVTVKEPSITLVDGTTYNVKSQKEYSMLTYSRTFSNTNWQSFYVPFSMSYDDWKEDFEVAKINDVNMYDTDDDGEADVTELEIIKVKKGTLKPNHPYMIKAKKAGDKVIKLTNATLYATEENSLDVSSAEMKFTFTGTYSGVSGDEMMNGHYYAMAGGELCYTDNNQASLKPYRWYMKVESRDPQVILPSKVANVRVRVVGENDEATEIVEVVADTENSVAPVYALDGRVVSKDGSREGLGAGIYIKNGKKFIVK